MSAPAVPQGVLERLARVQDAVRIHQEMTEERFDMLRELDAEGVFTDPRFREILKAAIY